MASWFLPPGTRSMLFPNTAFAVSINENEIRHFHFVHCRSITFIERVEPLVMQAFEFPLEIVRGILYQAECRSHNGCYDYRR